MGEKKWRLRSVSFTHRQNEIFVITQDFYIIPSHIIFRWFSFSLFLCFYRIFFWSNHPPPPQLPFFLYWKFTTNYYLFLNNTKRVSSGCWYVRAWTMCFFFWVLRFHISLFFPPRLVFIISIQFELHCITWNDTHNLFLKFFFFFYIRHLNTVSLYIAYKRLQSLFYFRLHLPKEFQEQTSDDGMCIYLKITLWYPSSGDM